MNNKTYIFMLEKTGLPVKTRVYGCRWCRSHQESFVRSCDYGWRARLPPKRRWAGHLRSFPVAHRMPYGDTDRHFPACSQATQGFRVPGLGIVPQAYLARSPSVCAHTPETWSKNAGETRSPAARSLNPVPVTGYILGRLTSGIWISGRWISGRWISGRCTSGRSTPEKVGLSSPAPMPSPSGRSISGRCRVTSSAARGFPGIAGVAAIPGPLGWAGVAAMLPGSGCCCMSAPGTYGSALAMAAVP